MQPHFQNIMSPATDSPDTDGEAPDGADKPPLQSVTSSSSSTTQTPTGRTGNTKRPSVPLPPPDANAHPKEPEYRGGDLAAAHFKEKSGSSSKAGYSSSQTPSATSSPTVSDSECWSAPSTAPPSRAPSRNPSMTGEKPIIQLPTPPAPAASPGRPKIFGSKDKKDDTVRAARAPSFTSDSGDKHKFNLKDLLASGPKLARRSSAKSVSSKKSDSDGGGAKSVAGESALSLTQKYGVCGKVAIGKGATSVVRLAHKWDRSEEKLYAIKVSPLSSLRTDLPSDEFAIGIPKTPEERNRKGVHQKAHR